MTIRKLGHFSVRTSQLEASRRFYVEILGLRVGYRPALDFPGLWLYAGNADADADFGVVHLIGTDGDSNAVTEYLGERTGDALGSGALDHLAFLADDMAGFRERLERHNIAYRIRTVPSLGLHQLFLSDPSGLTIEMNFPAAEMQESLAGASVCRAD
ncbi:VOC family protein [uncultured Hydrogenophaga sp.]|uniref:VOC family protein n=1 Tax=uncultured Hydrogenophaga sp. TaxID=199683 RepID=UPI002586C31A|nr:VOC family protein [uncultured Hydrogenophaga sp.]